MSLSAVRFRIPLGALISERYNVSPLSIMRLCFDVESAEGLQDCMLSVELRWHTNEQV